MIHKDTQNKVFIYVKQNIRFIDGLPLSKSQKINYGRDYSVVPFRYMLAHKQRRLRLQKGINIYSL